MVVDGHTAHFTGRLDHAIRYGPQQVRFDPPAAGAAMPMDWKAAVCRVVDIADMQPVVTN